MASPQRDKLKRGRDPREPMQPVRWGGDNNYLRDLQSTA